MHTHVTYVLIKVINLNDMKKETLTFIKKKIIIKAKIEFKRSFVN